MSTTDPINELAIQKLKGEFTQQSSNEIAANAKLYELTTKLMPEFGNQWNLHSVVAMKRQTLSRIAYYQHLYSLLLGVPGVICEFGVQWGATLATLINLRGMHEPFNHSRRIVGFDTFEGFPSVDALDGSKAKVGDYAVSSEYEKVLEQLLALHESFCPMPHIKKFQLVKGDASKTIDAWLSENPHAIIGMAIFDMDIYQPTKGVLQKILPRLTKGSLLVFDELNCEHFPGETRAVQEVLGLGNLRLQHFAHQPYCAYAVYGND
jgi:hypothetical protein